MKKIFSDTRKNDAFAREHYFLSEELMMENAAAALEHYSLELLQQSQPFAVERISILILCGKGNNGADGYTLARRIQDKNYAVTVCALEEPFSQMCKIQAERARAIGVPVITPYELDEFIDRKGIDLKLVIDCIFGAGFKGDVPATVQAVINRINSLDKEVKRLSCDIPTKGFYADITVTMGALKMPLFTDSAKDECGKIHVCNLGISRNNFEAEGQLFPTAMLLEETDLSLPFRKKQNVNKGTFGHLAVVSGEKPGAAMIAAKAAFSFGAGLVTSVTEPNTQTQFSEPEIMNNSQFPAKTDAIILGPGLGRNSSTRAKKISEFIIQNKIPCVLDADIFYYDFIESFLNSLSEKNIPAVLTPHPKEFSELLKHTDGTNLSVQEILENRESLVKNFVQKYPGLVLLLKGANSFIAVKNPQEQDARLYINSLGTSILAKAGSGDVLSGITGAFLAQGNNALTAACNASLIHAMGAKKMEPDFALTPSKLISLSLDAAASAQV